MTEIGGMDQKDSQFLIYLIKNLKGRIQQPGD